MVGHHGDDVAERALRQQPADLDDVRQEARPHRLHQKQPARPGGFDQLDGLAGVHRERLLDEDMLAGLQRQQAVFVVERVGSGDVDRVDIGILDERFVARVAALDAVPIGELIGARLAA